MKYKNILKTEKSSDCSKRPVYLISLILFLLLFSFFDSVQAQTIQVRGLVKDQKGDPIIGASIIEKGNSRNGTVTDIDGIFQLKVALKSILTITYIGYDAKEVPAISGKTMEIVLSENVKELNEVVVVGYGVQKKIAVTGAVDQVNMNDIKKSSAVSLDNTLAGRITGLISTQMGGGQPGVDQATMYLRGAATLNGTNPLILVDGATRNNYDELDPQEIESISVLKDASATAVFGVRGANGVIIITTKRGQTGKPQLSLNVEQSYTSFTKTDTRLHSWDYMALKNEALANDGVLPQYSADMIAKFKNPLWGLNPSDPNYRQEVVSREYLYCDHDYLKEFFKDYTPQTKINANLSGGTNVFKYFVNAGFVHQGGNLKTEPKSVLGYDPSSYMNRWNFRSNMDYNISSSLKSRLNIGTYIKTTNMPAAGGILFNGNQTWMMEDLFHDAQSMIPIQAGPTTISGYGVPSGIQISPTATTRSPYEVMNRRGFRNYTEVNLNSQFSLDWDLSEIVTKGLSLKGDVSYDSYGYTGEEGITSALSYNVIPNYDNGTFIYSLNNSTPQSLSIGKLGGSTTYRINGQASLNYQRIFNKKHEVGGMILGQRDYWESGADIPYNVIGLSGRATYNYDSRYFVEFDMGYNGSEQFAPSKRFGYFPAYSFGWVISNEAFMKNFKWLDNLKFRYSNGKVGNDQIGGNRFLYLDKIAVSTASYVSGLGTPSISSISQGLLGNKNLTWELSLKQNYGIDFGFLKEISLSLDYFTEKRSQILITRQTVPIFQGIPIGNIPKQNIGKVDNHGYELNFTYSKNITKDWNIQLKANYATNRNKVTFDDEPIRTSDYYYRYRITGFPISQCWGYKIDYSSNGGFWVSQDEINNSKVTYSFGTPRPGDFKYVDMNHDGVINDKDMVPIKYSRIPGINYGYNFATSYKNFDFSIFFQGLGHYSMYYTGNGVLENIGNGYYYNYQRTAWTAERWKAHEQITYPALTTTSDVSQQPNDFFIQNRAFIRLKNIELGYTVPKNSLKFLGVTSCRFYISGENLYVWDHLHTNQLDPEQNDAMGYPITKMVNAGLNINF